MLEEDANNVLKFMASNWLVANPSKTTLMFLNLKQEEMEEVKHTIVMWDWSQRYNNQL